MWLKINKYALMLVANKQFHHFTRFTSDKVMGTLWKQYVYVITQGKSTLTPKGAVCPGASADIHIRQSEI